MTSTTGSATRFSAHERSRLQAAALRSRRVLPGRVGELVQRELTSYADFGRRFSDDALIPRLAAEILATPSPRSTS